MSTHSFRFMETKRFDDHTVNVEYEIRGQSGFIAFCEKTGRASITFETETETETETDGWTLNPKAPTDPIERLAFALDRTCPGHTHELLEEA